MAFKPSKTKNVYSFIEVKFLLYEYNSLYFKNLCNFTQYKEKFTLISESHHETGIKTTSGEIRDIGFHAVCDPCIQI